MPHPNILNPTFIINLPFYKKVNFIKTKLMIRFLLLFFLTSSAFSQFNDTIFYKSGMEKVVEITEFTDLSLKFETVNSKGVIVSSQIGMNVVLRFVMYDEEGILQYDSRVTGEMTTIKESDFKYPSSISVSKHQLSINPFFIPFLSFNGKYNYRFGNKMQYSIVSRVTYISPILEDVYLFGDFYVAAGFQFAPFYNNRFAFGIDFAPQIGFYLNGFDGPSVLLPLSVDFDFYFNERIGLSADFGVGSLYGSSSSLILPRGHLGVLIQFKNKTTFETNYR